MVRAGRSRPSVFRSAEPEDQLSVSCAATPTAVSFRPNSRTQAGGHPATTPRSAPRDCALAVLGAEDEPLIVASWPDRS